MSLSARTGISSERNASLPDVLFLLNVTFGVQVSLSASLSCFGIIVRFLDAFLSLYVQFFACLVSVFVDVLALPRNFGPMSSKVVRK